MLTLAQESGSLVGREFAHWQSLGARLLVSVLRGAGATRNLDYINSDAQGQLTPQSVVRSG